MEQTLMGGYNISLILLSLIVILLTSYAVFDISARMLHVSMRKRGVWLVVGTLTMGGGFWSLHYIGMLAHMPATIDYDLMTLSLSFAITFFASLITLVVISQDKVKKNNFVLGCFILTASLVGMHYFGLKSIHTNAVITYSPSIMLLSVLLAFIPSVIFYKVIYDIRQKEAVLSMRTKLFSGFLLGLAIAVMHYTAMIGTEFTPHLDTISGNFLTIDASQLATFIGIASIALVILVLVSSYMDARLEVKNEELIEAESKYRSLVEQSIMGVYIFQDGKVSYINPRMEEILGYSQEELSKLQLKDFIYEEDIPLVTENISKRVNLTVPAIRYEFRAVRKDGTIAYLEVYGSTGRYQGKNAAMGTLVDITDRRKSEETILHMANYDYLTGLPNSNFLNERLVELVQGHKETAVLLLELDRLKTIKDTVGQETGNSLVLLASERIKQLLRERDILTRWQEDKFVILMPNTDQEHTAQIAQAILEAIAQPLTNARHDIYMNPSMGISLYPADGDTTEILLDMANSALTYAKKHGNNSFHFYTKDLNKKSRENLELEMDLYKAMEMDELMLHYQPQFHLGTGEYIGNEALIRWNHPTRGLVSPFHFIPIAEETGLIIPIGEWVLKTACAQNKAWQTAGFPPIEVSVNLSSRQFAQTNLVEVVEKVLAETQLEAKYLNLEITESMTMDVKRTICILQALKKLGVKISIDDFGTGYSSLSYLKEFPIDYLKIDQSFIRDCHLDQSNATIVKTIISMAHHLNIQVIAEGVETKEHLNFLQQNLCDSVQGYLLSKPISAESIELQFVDLQRSIRKFGLTSEISNRLWLERELEMTKHELQETIRQQDGMTLKYKLKDGKLIHTMCEGKLIYRLGLSPEKVVGKELADLLPLEKALIKEAFYQRAWKGEENVTYEGHVNGFVYLASLRPVFRKGKVVEVIASCVDITERKRAEEALRHSEMNYRLIAENTSDVIMIVDENGVILYTSPSCEAVTGYPIDHVIGSEGSLYIHPEDLPLIINTFRQIKSTKASILVQYRIIHKDNSFINLEAKITPVLGDHGDIEHFIAVVRDITAQKKSEAHWGT